MSDESVSLIEQRLFRRADDECRKVVQATLHDLRQTIYNQELRYRKVAFSSGTVVGYNNGVGAFLAVDLGDLLDAVESTMILALRNRFRAEHIDAFIARVEKSK